MADVFISYSKAQPGPTRALAGELQALGLTVWWDTELISAEPFRDVIRAELAAAKAVIVIWTASSVQSDWVYSEASRARAMNKLVQVKDGEVADHDLPPPFDALHAPLLSEREAIYAALARLGLAVRRPAPRRESRPEQAQERDLRRAQEIERWAAIKTSDDPHKFRDFLARHPDGEFADLARDRLDLIMSAEIARRQGTRMPWGLIGSATLTNAFVWYDFYLYATLAPFFISLYMPPGNDTWALASAFATYGAGYIARPLGGLVFGPLADRLGRKQPTVIATALLALATAAIGVLPTYASVGGLAPVLLLVLRLLHGIAVGGAYSGLAIYVAEHAPEGQKGYATGFIQTGATVGFVFALISIGLLRSQMGAQEFIQWGWRVPFLLALLTFAPLLFLAARYQESPVFAAARNAGLLARSPLREALFRVGNVKLVLLVLLGATAGQAVVWYVAQFYALYFLAVTAKVEIYTAYMIIGASMVVGTPFFIVFGWLADRIGPKPLILLGMILGILTAFPLMSAALQATNPALVAFSERVAVTVRADPQTCNTHMFVGPWSRFSECDRARDLLARSGLSFSFAATRPGEAGSVSIGAKSAPLGDIAKISAELRDAGLPQIADTARLRWGSADFWKAVSYFSILAICMTMVFGPLAMYMVELFPPQVRTTSFIIPYNVGNAVIGGISPLIGTALVANTGSIYAFLLYPLAVVAVSFLIGLLFLPHTRVQMLVAPAAQRR